MGLMPVPGEGQGGIPLPTLPPPVIGGGGGGVSAGSVNGALGSIVSYIGSVLGYANSFAGGLIQGLENALKQIFAQIVSLFQYLAQTWLGQILKSIWTTLKTIFQAIQKEISYIVKLFQQYEKLVRYWEQKILGPVLNIIQALRKTLVVFKLFHLKFATQLDNYLSGIEGRLTNIFLFYQRELNYIIDWLNLIVDPFGLISEGMFIGSAIRSIGAVWAGVMGYPSTTITKAQQTAAGGASSFYGEQSQLAYSKQLAAGGVPADDEGIDASMREGYAAMGYKV